MSHQPQNVAITGGCGFIGSNFVNYIHGAWPNCNFVNIDKLILNSDTQYVTKQVQNSPRYKLALTDIKNDREIVRILEENEIDTVVHFAADCTSTRCYNETCEAVQNNILSFIKFLDAVKTYGKIKKFVHISTDEVYGDSGLSEDEQGKVENSQLLPGNPYAATKIAGEAFVRAYIAQYNLPIVTARMNNIYGPNQWNVKVVPRFIQIATARGEYTIQGSGKQLRSWLYVDDASRGIQKVAEVGKLGEIYNLGSSYEKNVADLAKFIQEEVDRQLGRDYEPPRYKSIPDRPYNDLRYFISFEKAKEQLLWEPTTSFEEGMRNTIASELKKRESVKMRVAVYGGRGYVGMELQKSLEARNVPFVLATKKVGVHEDQEVISELASLNVTHVICVTGRTHGPGCNTIEYLEGGQDKVDINVRDNMYSATALAHFCRDLGLHYTYIGTGYMFAYDEQHPIGGQGFKEEDAPTFFGSAYSVVKGFTDRQMNYFNQKGWENLNVRITLPLSWDLQQPRNLLSKILNYRELFDIPVSITILPDCLDAMINLMEQRVGGTMNLVNPEPISLYQIVANYKKTVNDLNNMPTAIGSDSEKGKQFLATKGNCALDTTILQSLSPVEASFKSLNDHFASLV